MSGRKLFGAMAMAALMGVMTVSGAMAAEQPQQEEIVVQVDGVESIKAYGHVVDLGERITQFEITVEDITPYEEVAEDGFAINDSSEGISFELDGNVITVTCPDTEMSSRTAVTCEATGLCFTKEEIDEIEDSSIADFEEGSFTGSNGTEIIYRIRKGSAENQPLVLFFHGAGECGTDNRAHIVANRGAVAWAEYTDDATVLAAQYPEKYSTPFEEGQEEAMAAWLEAYTELIQSMIEDGSVDADRIYATGLSMGGGLAWEYVTRYPDLFAAIVTSATRGTVSEVVGNMDVLENCASLPTWLFHTAGDMVNDTQNSLDLYTALLALGNTNVHMTIYDKDGTEMNQYFNHASWIPALNDTAMMDWLFSQSRAAQAAEE